MGRDALKEPTWHKYWAAKMGEPDRWLSMSEIQRWRYLNRSTINTMLALAETSYLNLKDPVGHKKICQRILVEIRATRPNSS